MKNIFKIIILLLCFTTKTNACQCPPTILSKSECNKYDVIYRGKVQSVATCDDKPGVAVFEVQDVYKGNLTKQFKLMYRCDDECAIGFKEGEEWIIYTNYKQIDNGFMDWCSRSRKFIKNEKEDFYAVNYGNSYDDEVKFLQDSLGLHRIMKEQITAAQHRNQLPTVNQSIIILICSILSILLFYYLFNKFFK